MNSTELMEQLYRLERRLAAYQQLHADELSELWQALNACKEAAAALHQDRCDGANQHDVERRQG